MAIETVFIVLTVISTAIAITSELLALINKNKKGCKSLSEFIYKLVKLCVSKKDEETEEAPIELSEMDKERQEYLKKNSKN